MRGEWLQRCNKSWMYFNLAKQIIATAPTAEVYGQWISTEERLPADSGEYIVMIDGAARATCLFYDASEKVFYEENENGGITYRVSKWMPLPEV